MPHITTENDPTLFWMDVREAGTVYCDFLEFSSRTVADDVPDDSEAVTQESRSAVIKSFRAVAYPAELVEKMSDDQCYAFAAKMGKVAERAGNV